jgi:RNA polymerase sigma-70 factor, ECF subfamily
MAGLVDYFHERNSLSACNDFANHAPSAVVFASNRPGDFMTEAQQFEAFLRQHQDVVFSTAMRLLANRAEAEDVTQEVFLKAYARFGELAESPTVTGWLRTVARNLSLNHLTRYRSRWSFFSEILANRGEEEGEGTLDFEAPDNVEEQLMASDRQAFVERALAKLPAAQRVPLVLYHLEGQSYEEIAAQLGVSLGKVKTDIFRGRETLRKKLAPMKEIELGIVA